jgi:hypothetical protein
LKKTVIYENIRMKICLLEYQLYTSEKIHT